MQNTWKIVIQKIEREGERREGVSWWRGFRGGGGVVSREGTSKTFCFGFQHVKRALGPVVFKDGTLSWPGTAWSKIQN